MQALLTIASISLETGISKEVLRKWEERYGFPVPQRDPSGHRAYAAQQAVRLKLIKRLIDQGMRPARIVPLDLPGLQSLLQAETSAAHAPDADADVVAKLMALLCTHDRVALAAMLKVEIRRLGIEDFLLQVMCALNVEVGAAWERGEISIGVEHVYTEVMQSLIRKEISLIAQPDGVPRILITTLPGEVHTLGLLMVEALASLHGASCISLGAQTPIEAIGLTTSDYRADIVCLCFSAAFPKRRIAPLLKALRALVPKPAQIWIGGAGAGGLEHSPRGIKVLHSLQELLDALHQYRQARA